MSTETTCIILVLAAVGGYAAWFGPPDAVPVAHAAAGMLALIAWLSLVGGGTRRDGQEGHEKTTQRSAMGKRIPEPLELLPILSTVVGLLLFTWGIIYDLTIPGRPPHFLDLLMVGAALVAFGSFTAGEIPEP